MQIEQAESLAAVLHAIRDRRAITQPRLSRDLGLGRGVVAARVAELEAAGLLVHAGTGPSTGGRAPRQLRLRTEAGLVIGAGIGATGMTVGIADLAGRIIDHVVEPVDIADGPDVVLSRVETILDDLLAKHSEGRAIWGVGIGVPGPVEFSTGLPVAPPIMPGWDGYPIRDRLSRRWSAPSWIDNDVNVLALAELRTNPATADAQDLLYIKIGTGIGAGLVAGGRLHRGNDGCAGDIGHTGVAGAEYVICRCGNTGCLEAVAGGAALAEQGQRLAETGSSAYLADAMAATGQVTVADLAMAAAHDDTLARGLLTRTGELVGTTLATLVSFYNPSWVVLGGKVTRASDIVLAQIRETVQRRSLPLATRRLRIEPTTLGDTASLTGAVHLVLDELFAPGRLARWVPYSSPAGLLELVSDGETSAA